MLFVSASDLSASDLALLGNNLRPSRRRRNVTTGGRADRRVLAAVNRSLSPLKERVDGFCPASGKAAAATRPS